MASRSQFSVAMAAAVLAVMSGDVRAQVTVTINPSDIHQTIDGFGASEAGEGGNGIQDAATPLYTWPEPYRSQIMDLGFSDWSGIGLTVLRMRVRPSLEPTLGVWDYSDAAQVWIMQQASIRGPVKIIGSVWSPPAWMKTNNNTIGGTCSNNSNYYCLYDSECGSGNYCLTAGLIQDPARYQDFADLLSHFSMEYAAANGVSIYAVSMTNEPDTRSVPWDTCSWTSYQVMSFLGTYLAPTFSANHVTAKVIAPEAANWDYVEYQSPASPIVSPPYLYSTEWANQNNALDRLDIAAGHTYFGTPSRPFPTALAIGKKSWQTEVSGKHHTWDMDGALSWAKEIHDGLTSAQISAWLWWIMFSGQVGDEGSAGLIGWNPDSSVTGSHMLYTLGNFSKFVRPGFVRIGTSATGDPNLNISAYKDPSNGEIVIVAINQNAASSSVVFSGLTHAIATPHITSDSVPDLRAQPDVNLSTGVWVPGRSVVTYVTYTPGDLLWRNTSGAVTLWIGNGTGSPTSIQLPVIPGSDWQIQKTGDFDGDRTTDILWRNTSGEMKVWFLNRSGIAAQTSLMLNGVLVSVPAVLQIQGVADFDGDGKADMLLRNTQTGALTVWLMQGAAISAQIPLTTAPRNDWQVQATGDFDGNGKTDILWRNTGSLEVKIWFMNGGTILQQLPIVVAPNPYPESAWQVSGVGDFNNDGKSDILWRKRDGSVKVWLLNGTTILSQPQPGILPIDWQISGILDFDADGMSDIVFRSLSTGTVKAWTLHNGSFGAETVFNASPQPSWQTQGVGNFDQ